MKRILFFNLFVLLFLAVSPLEAAEEHTLTIAVASNFTRTMEGLAKAFKEESGITVQTSYSSTGRLYAQIRHGAPFDLFFAADAKRPALLHKEGLCSEPFVYAHGKAVLWSGRVDLAGVPNWQAVLARKDVKKIAIANPETAPYGAGVLTVLQEAGIWKQIKGRIVFAQNVAQAFQYARHGSLDAAFTAGSFALSKEGRMGASWQMAEAPLITQKGCVVEGSLRKDAVGGFLVFLSSEKARSLITDHGYR